ncbi:MAG: rhodanese-like domain-containing protein, partial [Myxococcales bacterium]|nr:rhodanese-like domain-containing protein [Myxococcales bacterium]
MSSAVASSAISRLPPGAARGLPGALWLDVRTRAERSQGYLAGSRLLPLDELPRRLPELEGVKDRNIVLVCASGHRATEAASVLQRAGFSRLHVLEGGLLAWDQPLTAPRLDPDGLGFVERFRVGASFLVVQQPDDEHPRAGLEVHAVYPGGVAQGKLHVGDVVEREGEGEVSYRSLFPPGKSLQLRVISPDGVARTETLTPPPPPPPLTPPPPLPGPLSEPWQREVVPVLDSPEGIALRRAFQEQAQAWAPSALPLPASLLLDPARLASLLASPPGDFQEREPRALLLRALEESEALLGVKKDFNRRAEKTGAGECCGTAEALVRWVAGQVRASRREATRALDGFLDQERKMFAERAARLRGAVERQVFLHDARERGEVMELAALAEEGRRFRAGACVMGVRRLARVLDSAVLTALVGASWPEREAPAGSGVEGLVRGWLDMPEGPVVLGGQGANRYRGRFLAILDMGGDDRYEMRSGEEPSLVLDLAGDDVYTVEEEAAWAPGRALLLADLAGNDRYRSVGAGLASG